MAPLNGYVATGASKGASAGVALAGGATPDGGEGDEREQASTNASARGRSDTARVIGDVPIIIGDASIIIGDASIFIGDASTVIGDASIVIGDLPIFVGEA
jgi:hypothetical protein